MTVNALTPLGDWLEQAACKGKPAAIFFPIGSGSKSDLKRGNANDLYATARSICATCPVLVPCRNYALAVVASGKQLDGCWGGTNEAQRIALVGRKVGWAS